MSQPPGGPEPEVPRDPWASPPPGYPGQPLPAYGPPPTNPTAQAAMWTGVGLLVTSCCALGLLGFIPILLGVRARREIRQSRGSQGGDGMALTGIVTGAVAIVVSLLLVALVALVVAIPLSGGGSSYSTTTSNT